MAAQSSRALRILSKRTHFELEIHCHWGLEGRERLIKFVDATRGSAKLTFCDYMRVGRYPRGGPGVVLSTETVDRRSAADQTLSGKEEGTKRIVCWMRERDEKREGVVFCYLRLFASISISLVPNAVKPLANTLSRKCNNSLFALIRLFL
jgi:hypothetical protein